MKYIVLTVLLLIALTLFSGYEKKFNEAENIADFFNKNKFLKDSKIFDIEKNYSFSGNYELALSGLDLGTIRMLDQDLSGALALFLDKETMTYKDYFNKGNILLRLGVKHFNKDDIKSQEYLLGATNSYNTAIKNIETDEKLRNSCFENISIAINLRNLLEIKSYIIFLAEFIKKTDNIISQIKDLQLVIINQIQSLQKFEKGVRDEELKKCINNIKKEIVENYNGLTSNESFFSKIRENLLTALERIKNKRSVNKKYMENKKKLEKKFQGSLNTMLDYFKKFQKLQGELSNIIESKDENKLRQLCKEQDENKDEEEDEDVKDAYKNLSKLLDQQQQNQQQEQGQESQASGSNQNMHFDMTDQQMEKYSEKIEQQNKEWIEKIEERKNSEGYKPSELLNELFKEFLGEDKDFRNEENSDFNGNTPRNW